MDDKEIKDIINEIDDLVTKVTEDGEEPSEEVMESIEELTSQIELLKDKKQVDYSKGLNEKLDTLIEVIHNGDKLSTDNVQRIADSIKAIKIDVPQVTVAPPEVTVNVPEVKVPPINIPEQKIPEPKVYFPDEIDIKKPSWISEIVDLSVVLKGMKAIFDTIRAFKLPTDPKNPISVRLSNGEKFYNAIGGMTSAIAGAFPFKKADGTDQAALVDDTGRLQIAVQSSTGLNLNSYDYCSRSVNSATVTYTFKLGGASGKVTNTVVVVYTDATLTTISTITKT